MNDSTRRALDRINRALDRQHQGSRRPAGFSTSPLVLAGALVLGYHLLVRVVPGLWAGILPDGLGSVAHLVGWPAIVWRAAWFCHTRFPAVVTGVVAIVAIGLIFGRARATRPLAWLMAVAAIAADAGILFVAIRAGMDAAGIGRALG